MLRSLMIVPVLAIGLAMPAAAQQKQSFSFSKSSAETRYTQENMIDVGDVPGHQVRIFEITYPFKKDELAFDGVAVKEYWVRGMSDYTNWSGAATRAVQRSLLELLRIVSPKSHTAGYSTARLPISDSRLPECLTP